jgi:hypothetical protein
MGVSVVNQCYKRQRDGSEHQLKADRREFHFRDVTQGMTKTA